MPAVLTVGMTTVRQEFNTVFPGRDKRSDGWIGDLAHQGGVSGHNPDRTGRAEYKDGDSLDEVRAIDVDRDLVPGSDVDWMELVVQYIVRRARAGHYVPFRYVIYKGRIWSRTDGWQTRAYTGANRHDKHAHFSGDYTQKADGWTGSLGLATVRGKENNVSKQDVTAALTEPIPYTSAPGKRLANAGLGPVSIKTELDYIWEAVRGLAAQVSTVYGAVLNVDEEVLAGLGQPEMPAEELAALLRKLPGVAGREAEVAQALTSAGQGGEAG